MIKISERMMKGLKIAAVIFTILFTASFIVPVGCRALPLYQYKYKLPPNYYIDGWRVLENGCYGEGNICSLEADDIIGISARGACLETFDWFGLINMDQYQNQGFGDF